MFPPPLTTSCSQLDSTERAILFRQSLTSGFQSTSAKESILSQLHDQTKIVASRAHTPSFRKQQLNLQRKKYNLQAAKSLPTMKSSMTNSLSSFDNLNNVNPATEFPSPSPSPTHFQLQSFQSNTGGYAPIDPHEQSLIDKEKQKTWLHGISEPRQRKKKDLRPSLSEVLGGDPNDFRTGTPFAQVGHNNNNNNDLHENSVMTEASAAVSAANSGSRTASPPKSSGHHRNMLTSSLSKSSRERRSSSGHHHPSHHYSSTSTNHFNRSKIDLQATSDSVKAMSLFNFYNKSRIHRSEQEIKAIQHRKIFGFSAPNTPVASKKNFQGENGGDDENNNVSLQLIDQPSPRPDPSAKPFVYLDDTFYDSELENKDDEFTCSSSNQKGLAPKPKCNLSQKLSDEQKLMYASTIDAKTTYKSIHREVADKRTFLPTETKYDTDVAPHDPKNNIKTFLQR